MCLNWAGARCRLCLLPQHVPVPLAVTPAAILPPCVTYCSLRWLPDERTVACYNGNIRCPPHVTPLFLEEGKNQGVCSAERDVYFCNVKCTEDGNVLWEGSVCPNDLVSPCPPWKRTLVPEFTAISRGDVGDPTALHGPDPLLPTPSGDGDKAALRGGVDKLSGEYLFSTATDGDKEYITKTGGFDLRGIQVGVVVLPSWGSSVLGLIAFMGSFAGVDNARWMESAVVLSCHCGVAV